MACYRFHLMNGFAERRQAGAAVAVVECEAFPDDATLHAIAFQLNAPETVFIEPGTGRARAFTAQYPLPTSGHGAIAIAAALEDRLTHAVDFGHGPITTWQENGIWWFYAEAPKSRLVVLPVEGLTNALWIEFGDLTGQNLFVDTGLDQLMVPLRNQHAVLKARPKPEVLAQLADNGRHIPQLALWHQEGDVVTLRSFSSDQLNVYEEFGAADSAANIAGWRLATGSVAPFSFKVEQGISIQRVHTRLSVMHVSVDVRRRIAVGGRMWKIGTGELEF
ncbi:PhzF family phenazine biosynthesis protein [Andreprevotia chitinilytica]|uniref:PhzF family phenazine biosynthesis protein n=1 Tax=Andreprevotia chitinilytica TaxID=396808 RepID=UPI00054ED545|nr:PhzF family phenazine biosynthesis protein [Andreprevotia chitinilytica]